MTAPVIYSDPARQAHYQANYERYRSVAKRFPLTEGTARKLIAMGFMNATARRKAA